MSRAGGVSTTPQRTVFNDDTRLGDTINQGAIITGATIATSSAPAGGFANTYPVVFSDVRVSPAAAVTGIILSPGLRDRQMVIVHNEAAAANSVTFAALATSNVADGVSDVIAGLTARAFRWNASANGGAGQWDRLG